MNILNSLNSIDSLVNYVESKSIDQIIDEVSQLYNIDINTLCNYPMGGYSKGRTSGSYYFVIKDIKENIYKYEWLYHRLADINSRKVLLNLLCYRLTTSINFIKDSFDGSNDQYFDKNIIKCDENEVFVDCGAYIGDTVESYIKNYKKYKKIYSYEPSRENFNKCIENTKKYKNVGVRPFGVGEKNKQVYFSESGSSSSIINSKNSEVINIISIDDDIKEKITYLKMDVECEEINAILGAKNHIKYNSPKLAICLYHIVSDLWEIPELINSINSNYEFYIRHYEEAVAWETVLYAIPKKVNKNNKINKRGFYVFPFTEKCIKNVTLTQDVGLIPYFMYKKIGYNSVIVSDSDETMPHLKNYVTGLKVDLINPQLSFNEGIYNYIAINYKNIDTLMLFGIYETYFNHLKFYKRLRPDGKVYLKLDANSGWMDRIDFNDATIINFLNSVDLVSVESRQMKKYLSAKIPYKKIEYIPNGYFNYTDNDSVEFKEKENTIITVGRIGTQQKNNEVLLEAFGLISHEIPNWKLKLVGNIDENFNAYIESYFNKRPDLKNRVIFTGNINCKEDLFNEYKRSKIFALTSIFEGGTPNVYSEAALNGNYIITSNIDGCMDMTNNLKCGDVFDIGDVNGLADILLKRCQDNEYLESKCKEIQKYVRTYFDYEKIVSKIDYLLNLD